MEPATSASRPARPWCRRGRRVVRLYQPGRRARPADPSARLVGPTRPPRPSHARHPARPPLRPTTAAPASRASGVGRGSRTTTPTARWSRTTSASGSRRWSSRRPGPTSGVSPSANGHLQATGRDDKGRKQYRYHDDWNAHRNRLKFDRMVPFGRALPEIRARAEADLRHRQLDREKVLALCVRLLDETLVRVGNEQYAAENHTYGLTTIRDKHVSFDGAEVRFEFVGKSGKTQSLAVHDRRLARLVKECRDIPRLRPVPVLRRGRRPPRRGVGPRQRLPPGDDGRGVHGQGLPDVGRDRHGRPGARGARRRLGRRRRRRAGDAGRQGHGGPAGQHAGRVPPVLRPPRRRRRLPGARPRRPARAPQRRQHARRPAPARGPPCSTCWRNGSASPGLAG